MVRPVRLVKVDIVGVETFEAGLDGAGDIVAIHRRHAGALGGLDPAVRRAGHFGGDDQGVPVLGLHPAPDDLLGAAGPFRIRRDGVVFGRVVEVDARIIAFVENAEGFLLVGLGPEGHSAHADVGYVNGAFAKAAMFHDSPPGFRFMGTD